MIQPIQQETYFPRARGSLEGLHDPRIRWHAPVSLLVHVETALVWQRERPGHGRALAVTGNLHLPELRAEITFCSHNGHANGNGHTEERRTTAAIIPHDFRMPVPLLALALLSREDSDVWALIPSPDHERPWMEHYAGRLEAEPLTFDQYVPVEGTLDVTFTSEECDDDGGAKVDVAGELRFERPVHMRLLFRDPEQSTGPPLDARDLVLIAAGSVVPIPSQTLSRLASHTPWMTVRVIEPRGRVVCPEQTLTGPARSAS